LGVWERSLQPPEDGGLGAKLPAAGGKGIDFGGGTLRAGKLLKFFNKSNAFLCIEAKIVILKQ